MTTKAVALKPMSYGSERYDVGDSFEVIDPKHMLVLSAAGMAREQEDEPVRKAPKDKDKKKKKGAYKRRDMVSE